MLFFITGTEGVERFARRLLTEAVKLTLTTEEVAAGLAHTVEGLVTPLVREEAPERTGALRDSLRAHVSQEGGAFVVTLESDAPYLDYVLHGTGIYHVPDAREAWDVEGYQHFTVNGQDIHVMHTHHQGQKSNDFGARGLERAGPAIDVAMAAAGERILVSFRP